MFVMSNINIFTKPQYRMQANNAVHLAANTIDIMLEKGAEKLYNKYLGQKLPSHTHTQNATMLVNNLNMHEIAKPARRNIESVPLAVVEAAALDVHAPKRTPIKKHIDGLSTLSPKNTTFCRSTKYNTILTGQKSSGSKQGNTENQNHSMLSEENFGEGALSSRKERPMTIQTARNKQSANNYLSLESKVEEVEEKRAATCHTRKRQPFVSSKDKRKQMIRLKEDTPVVLAEEVETANRFKRYKKEKLEEEMEKESERAKVDAYVLDEIMQYKMKEKRTRESYQEMKRKLKGKSIQNPTITNFQSSNGQILINGRAKQQRTHIIQLQFNPEEERTSNSQEARVMSVNSTKKVAFVAKLKKKLKITNEEYTNNGSRQISSIPFMALSCGIALSESILDATASRRRPAEEISREQYTTENPSSRFKSHIPIVNSARLNAFATLDESSIPMARSSIMANTLSVERKDFQTTISSRRQLTDSLLWKPRCQSQNRNIRITNKQAFHEEILDMKLGQ